MNTGKPPGGNPKDDATPARRRETGVGTPGCVLAIEAVLRHFRMAAAGEAQIDAADLRAHAASLRRAAAVIEAAAALEAFETEGGA